MFRGAVIRKNHRYYANKKEVPIIKRLTKELKDDGILNSYDCTFIKLPALEKNDS